MTATHSQSDLPTPFEMGESVLLLITGAVVGAPMLPGFTFCIPGLILFSVVVVAPLVAAAVLVVVAGAILAVPYLLVRSVRNIRSHRAAPAHTSASADNARPRAFAVSRRLG